MTIKQLALQTAVRASIALNRILSPLGIRVSRRQPPRRRTRDLIGDLFAGQEEVYVVDVGTAAGNFSGDVLNVVPQARILCVEPIPRYQDTLRERFKDDRVTVVRAAAGDRDGEVVFHETQSPDCSSILPMGRHKLDFPSVSDQVATYTVPLRCLDTILSGEERPIDLLKIDVQGSELAVLKGAEQTLPRCRHVLVEMSLRPLYEGQASFEEVVCFMHGRGFQMVDYIEGARSHVTRELIQMDFLYRSSHWLAENPDTSKAEFV